MPASVAADTQMLSVNVPVANFRDGPSTKHDILFTATQYFPVKVLKQKGSWVQVIDFEKEKSWVASRLLSKRKTVIITVDQGNVRASASTSSKVVDKVERGQVYVVKKCKGSWCAIATELGAKALGWVRNDLTWGSDG